MNTSVRVIADDLTGALDSAVAFLPWQEANTPLPVFPRTNAVSNLGDNAALNLNNRDVDYPVDTLAEAAGFFADALAYCKIDSLLRGFPAEHTALCWRERNFPLVVVAPAFPAQGRVTRQGVVYANGQALTEASKHFAAGLARLAPPFYHLGRKPDTLPEQGVLLCDAHQQNDLHVLVQQVIRHHPPQDVLWVGSGGLARALADTITPERQSAHPLSQPSLGLPLLFVIASFHPVTLQQLDRLRTLPPVHALSGVSVAEDSHSPADKASVILAHIDVASMTREQASQHLTEQLEQLTIRYRPPFVVVSGGDTLAHVCAVTKTQALELVAEYQTGMPLFRFRGGRWHDTLSMSKSGAFGQEHVYQHLVQHLLDNPHYAQQRMVL